MQLENITTKLPPVPPKVPNPWKAWAGSLFRGLYGIMITLLASLGATVLLNPSLRTAVWEILRGIWGGI